MTDNNFIKDEGLKARLLEKEMKTKQEYIFNPSAEKNFGGVDFSNEEYGASQSKDYLNNFTIKKENSLLEKFLGFFGLQKVLQVLQEVLLKLIIEVFSENSLLGNSQFKSKIKGLLLKLLLMIQLRLLLRLFRALLLSKQALIENERSIGGSSKEKERIKEKNLNLLNAEFLGGKKNLEIMERRSLELSNAQEIVSSKFASENLWHSQKIFPEIANYIQSKSLSMASYDSMNSSNNQLNQKFNIGYGLLLYSNINNNPNHFLVANADVIYNPIIGTLIGKLIDFTFNKISELTTSIPSSVPHNFVKPTHKDNHEFSHKWPTVMTLGADYKSYIANEHERNQNRENNKEFLSK